MDKIIALEKQIQKLKKRREQIQTRRAVLFFKDVEKIFKNGFCPALVLDILTKTYETTSAIQQQEWEKRAPSFHTKPIHSTCKNPQTTEPTHHQGWREKIPDDA